MVQLRRDLVGMGIRAFLWFVRPYLGTYIVKHEHWVAPLSKEIQWNRMGTLRNTLRTQSEFGDVI